MPVVITGNNTPTAGGITYGDGSTYVNTAAGTAGQLLQSNGASTPVWATISTTPTLVRSARTSNTILGTADTSTLIAITSGTFTQTFTAAATLGSGWFCYIQNAGTGDITLDPNASELIDGLSSYIMYPGEARLVQCDGSGFNTIVLDAFLATFTASGTFTKPPGYSLYGGFVWGAGGGGGKASIDANIGGGGGGACVAVTLLATAVGTTETITIGAGGTGTTANGSGLVGGNTTLGSLVTSYGGGGGGGSESENRTGGGGGGIFSVGVTSTPGSTSTNGGEPYTGDASATTGGIRFLSQNFGGGGTQSSRAGPSAYGGGAGGSGTANGGASLYGGAGGGGVSGNTSASNGGTSVFGGSGGNGSRGSSGTNGTAPGGGGGATQTGTKAGDGARGEVRIWGIV